MSADYRILAADLFTNEVREEIPFSNVRYSRVLNRPGSFSGDLQYDHPKCTRTNLDPSRTAIYVVRDGVYVWGGILWTAKVSGRGSVSFGAEGFWSYFRRRLIRTDKIYSGSDQLAIVRDLITYAQGIEGGDIGVTVGSETCGVTRDRSYYAHEFKNLGEAVEQLSEVENGFDFEVFVADNETRTLRLHYPKQGVRQTNLRFDFGANLEDLTWSLDGTEQANTIIGIGSGEGDAMLTTVSADTTGLGTSIPLLEGTVSYKDVSEASTLKAHADSALDVRKDPIETIPTLVAHNVAQTLVGVVNPGDEIFVKANDGYYEINSYQRVQAIEVSVSDEARESVSFEFAKVDAG